MSKANLAKVLVAEDDESDWLLLQMAFEQAGIPVDLVWARDGVETIERLKAEHQLVLAGNDQSELRLLLLDLKMPQMTGFEVLEWWQGQPQLMDLAVVVFSSSANPQDVEESTRLGAREHVPKPTGFDLLVKSVRNLTERYVLTK